MRLIDYLKKNELTDKDFAEILGGDVSEGAVKKWKYGERNPRLPEVVRIEDATHGEVTARDFISGAAA